MWNVTPIVLLAVAGFLAGGVYARWRRAKYVSAVVLGVLAALAAVTGILELL